MSRSFLCSVLAVTALSVPAVGQVQNGLQTGPELPVPSKPSEGGSSRGFVNFDDFPGPCLFGETAAATNEFAAFGVTFSGPSGNDGGAVLNECSNFGVTGQSSPNFLAFNTEGVLDDGGIPQGPETMTFDPLVDGVTINCGSGIAFGPVTLECFDGGGISLGSDTIDLSPALAPLTISAPNTALCVLSHTPSAFVCDDLNFVQVPVELQAFDVE